MSSRQEPFKQPGSAAGFSSGSGETSCTDPTKSSTKKPGEKPDKPDKPSKTGGTGNTITADLSFSTTGTQVQINLDPLPDGATNVSVNWNGANLYNAAPSGLTTLNGTCTSGSTNVLTVIVTFPGRIDTYRNSTIIATPSSVQPNVPLLKT